MGNISMEWTLRAESSGNPLTDVHQHAFHQVADLYHLQNPTELETYRRRAEHLQSEFTVPHREALVSALRPHMLALGASEACLRQLERLRDPRSVAVVTGQQAGLFTGPLYALYKALSAIGMAERLEQELDRPVVPIFWVASEDHDWGEVNHAYVLDGDEEIRKLRLQQDVPLHQMVFHTQLTPDAVQRVLADAHHALPEAPYKYEVLAQIEEAFADGMAMSDWFAKQLLHMLAPKGIVMLDPCLPSLRALIRPVWKHALQNVADVQTELDAVYQDVTRRGFEPPVIRDVTNTTVFYVEDGKRFVLETTSEGRLRARGLGVEKSLEEWLALAEERPENFSSNVLLRPVVQDALLPTLAYVGGPAEVAYHALAGAVFRAHGRTLPPLILRHRLRLFPPTVRRQMEKWGLTTDVLNQPLDVAHWLRTRLEGSALEDAVAALQEQTRARWAAWVEQFGHVGPQVRELTDRHIARELAGIERVARKTRRQFELQHDVELRQLHHVNRWLWTDGHPQERRLSPLNLWTKYGVRWLVEAPIWLEPPASVGTYDVFFN
jgi:bacillithiol biosynthesis cysteine-adding enzyme BshC